MKIVEIVFEEISVSEREAIVALLESEGFDGFWQDGNTLKAYVNEDQYDSSLLDSVKEFSTKYKVNLIEETNWNKMWESNFEPVKVEDNLLIRAPFHDSEPHFQREIIIEPQMSFGTGHHQTTFLMARYLIGQDLEGKTVLDMGCGTGVLAILAVFKNAKEVYAIDIEEGAVNNTHLNMKHNQIENIHVIHGGAEVIPDIQMDVIIANINKNILIKDLSEYAKHLAVGGKLLMSGFFTTDLEEIVDESSKNSLYLLDSFDEENWCMMVLEKK